MGRCVERSAVGHTGCCRRRHHGRPPVVHLRLHRPPEGCGPRPRFHQSGRRLVVAFQPHLYSRTRDFAREFACSLAAGDSVYLTEIYAAREKPIPGVTADLIVDAFGPEKRKLSWRGSAA